MDEASKSKKKIITLSVIILLIISAIGCASYYGYKTFSVPTNQGEVVLEVGGEKVYLKEYKERVFAAKGGVGTLENPGIDKTVKEPVLNELVELKIIDKELSKKSIKLSDAEIIQEAKTIFKDYDNRDTEEQKAYRDYVSLKIGKAKLLDEVSTWKEGYVLYCYFNRGYQDDMKNKPESKDRVSKDEVYAKDYCTKVKERLETGKSTFQEEQDKLSTDPIMGNASWKPYRMPYGEEFNKSTFSSKNFHSAFGLFPKLSELGNEKNKFYLLTLQESVRKGENDPIEKKDALFVVVNIKDANKGETADFDKWLKDKENEYKVKRYIERIN